MEVVEGRDMHSKDMLIVAISSRHCLLQLIKGFLLCRRKHLTALGWTIVCVPYYEWTPLTEPGDRVGVTLRLHSACICVYVFV